MPTWRGLEETMTQFRVGDIQPNPFRHMDRYPIRRDKVETLKESLRTTGFWGNVVARVGGDGKPQIAYGHHRLTALKEQYGLDEAVTLIIRDLDDDQMLKIMARENMEEWGTSAAVEQETVRAVVEAYAEGKIFLPTPAESASANQIRYAPSFIMGDPSRPAGSHPYTAREVAEFLGWLKPSGRPSDKVAYALSALQFIEEGILSEADFDGLSTAQASAVVEQARRVRRERESAARLAEQEAERARKQAEEAERQRAEAQRRQREAQERATQAQAEAERRREEEYARQQQAEAERRREEAERAERQRRASEARAAEQRAEGRRAASAVGRHVSSGMRSGEVGYKKAAESAYDAGYTPPPSKPKMPPHIDDFAMKLAASLNKLLEPDIDRNVHVRDLELFIQFREHAQDRSRAEIAQVLREIANRALSYAQRLTDGTTEPQPVFLAEVINELPVGGA
jgi:nitrogen regulatory protein PII